MNNTSVHAAFLKNRYLCLAAAMVICVCAGFGYAWSVLQTPIIAAYQWPDTAVSVAYTITVVCSTMAPLFFGGLIRKLTTRQGIILGAALYGIGLFATGMMAQIWQLYLCYGVLAGLGVGFIYPSMMAYVVRLFPDKAGFASGLGTAAYGSGAILWAPTAAALTEGLGLPSTFRVLGIAFAVVILLGSLVLRDPPEGFRESMTPAASAQGGGDRDLNRGQMVKTGRFYLMVAVFTSGLIAGVIIISQASPILQRALGFTPATAAVFVSVFAACNMAGRFVWGGLSDKLGLRNTATAVFVLCVLSMVSLTVLKAPVIVLVSMGLAASCYGGFASVLTPMTAQMFGSRYITENYGVMYVVFGLASLVGPNMASAFQAAAGGSYTGAYVVAAVLSAVGLILSRFLKRNESR